MSEEAKLRTAKRMASELFSKSVPRPLYEISKEIKSDWKNPNYAAVPYLEAMGSLNSISENYYNDSGKSVVLYFLANAGSWRGDVARRVKAELKKLAS